mmetsp:Transcript_67050/g.178850  ORF Transcript_67050/g.178850 Transcript_67050/m.178850 type:complete len:204 (+) Transcript_67050:445-1056(+)
MRVISSGEHGCPCSARAVSWAFADKSRVLRSALRARMVLFCDLSSSALALARRIMLCCSFSRRAFSCIAVITAARFSCHSCSSALVGRTNLSRPCQRSANRSCIRPTLSHILPKAYTISYSTACTSFDQTWPSDTRLQAYTNSDTDTTPAFQASWGWHVDPARRMTSRASDSSSRSTPICFNRRRSSGSATSCSSCRCWMNPG